MSSMPPSQSYANYQSGKRMIWTIIGLNAAVFGTWNYAIANKDQKLLRTMSDHFLLSEGNVKEGRYHTLVTSAFSHTNLGHFFFNMVWLHIKI